MTSSKISLTLVVSLFLSLNISADTKLAVHLLSYLAQDYGEAVQNGKVASQAEYAEQLDFLSEVERVAERENFPVHLKKEIPILRSLIENKALVSEVAMKANGIKWLLIREYKIATSPEKTPDLILGEKIYRSNCVQCHGQSGNGDGELGRELDPAPTNFHDKERMSAISPFQAFTTITLGVPGTGMQSFSEYSEHERWSLAYYIHQFHLLRPSETNVEKIPLKELSSLSDNEILTKYYKGMASKDHFIADLRQSSLTNGKDETTYFDSKLSNARTKLNESFEQYQKKDLSGAVKLSLESYLEGIEPVEPLLGQKELSAIEEAYGSYRTLLRLDNKQNVSDLHRKILSQIDKLSPTRKNSPWNSILLSFGIVFREALEAVLVIVLLLSILKKVEAPKGRVWIHAGWIAALLLGISVFYLIQDSLLSNMGSVEKIEGYLGLIAVVVLLYVGLWFHGKQNIDQWKNLLKEKIHGQIANGKMLGLATLSFTAVFREIIETIIFLKVLQLDGHETRPLFQGVLLAVVLTLLLGILMSKFYLKLNIGRLISVSTFLILFLSLVILGKSVHALQLAGIISSTKLFAFSLPVIGLYGTIESIVGQILLLLLIGGWVMKSKQKSK